MTVASHTGIETLHIIKIALYWYDYMYVLTSLCFSSRQLRDLSSTFISSTVVACAGSLESPCISSPPLSFFIVRMSSRISTSISITFLWNSNVLKPMIIIIRHIIKGQVYHYNNNHQQIYISFFFFCLKY